jgi:dTDP-glucose 4,6-dehydratase
MKILITGGAGFIGSEFVRQAVARRMRVTVCDKLTYCGDRRRLARIKGRFVFYKADIRNKAAITRILRREKPEIIVNFAAETHVDRSIADGAPFIETNVVGTQVLLDCCRSFAIKRFIQISTDEVYGEIFNGSFSETSALSPNSPYSASKAGADLLIGSYSRTFGLPCVIVRPCNNYGPWQFPEKLIPVVIKKALQNKTVPVYAKGLNRREWLFVNDCCRAIMAVMEKGANGQVYNIGSGQERRNIDVVKDILGMLKKPESLITYVPDRPGHDFRYSLDFNRTRALGWKPSISFDKGLQITVAWYLRNQKWLFSKGLK